MAARISASCNPASLAILWSRRRHRHAGTEQHARGDAQDDERHLQDRWAAPGCGKYPGRVGDALSDRLCRAKVAGISSTGGRLGRARVTFVILGH